MNGLFKKGEPCTHPGCFNHVSHPCEGCGRIAGNYQAHLCQECGYDVFQTIGNKVSCSKCGEVRGYIVLQTDFYRVEGFVNR